MSEVLDKARLVPAFDGRGVTATVARSEILEALRSQDEPPELVLDVLRKDAPADEFDTLRFEWDPKELEEILRRSDGESVDLVFDEAALEQALARLDVEAHGVREKALIVAVAIATAAAGAGKATAASSVTAGDGAGGAKAAQVAPPRGPVHPAEGTGLIPTPGVERAAPPRGASHPAEGTGFVETPGVVASSPSDGISISTQDAVTAGVLGGGVVLLIASAGFAARGERRHSLRPA